jgi:hypothetical protein
MAWMNEKEIKDLLENEYELGDLCLGIFCTKCNAQFELGKGAVAMATMTKTPFWDYVKWIQSSKCPICNKE